jgi:hypothetical protein
MKPRRQDQFKITATIDGEDAGPFTEMKGGESEADSSKIREGGGEDEIPLGGPKSVSDITLTHTYRPDRDSLLLTRWHGRTGLAAVVIKKQPLDDDLNAFGQPRVYTGILQKTGDPETNANANDTATFDLEISAASRVA